MGFVALLGQLPKVAADVAGIATFGFQFNGHVCDAEIRGCAMSGLLVSSVPCGRDQGIPVATVR